MANPKQMKQNQYVVLFMSAVLLFGAFNAVLVTADEYDPSTIVWMNFGLDLVLLACLVALLTVISRSAEPSGLKSAALAAGVLGVIAALIKLYARFSSDHGWWTGHFNYAIGG